MDKGEERNAKRVSGRLFRFADAAETAGSAAENYQLTSEAPLARDISEEEKRFVGDLTARCTPAEIGSPVTNSENLSSTLSQPPVRDLSSGRRQRSPSPGDWEVDLNDEEPLADRASTDTDTTVDARRSPELSKQSPRWQRSSPRSKSASPAELEEVASSRWVGLDDATHTAAADARPSPGRRQQAAPRELKEVASTQWRGLDDAPQLAGPSAVPADEDGVLRARFLATFDRPEKMPIRLLQTFDITYEKVPRDPRETLSGRLLAQQLQPQEDEEGEQQLRVSEDKQSLLQSAKPATSQQAAQRTRHKSMRQQSSRESSQDDYDPLAKWNIDDMVASETNFKSRESKTPGSSESPFKRNLMFDSDSDPEDFEIFKKEELLSLPKPKADADKDKARNLADLENTDGDNHLFNKLMENLDAIMRGADTAPSQPNVYNVRKLVSKEDQDASGQADNRLVQISDKPTTNAVHKNYPPELMQEESCSTETFLRAIGGTVPGGSGGDRSARSSIDSHEDESSTDFAAGGERRRQKPPRRDHSHGLSTDTIQANEDPGAKLGIRQVYSNYLTGDSHERVKRKIACHYLTHSYGSRQSMLQVDNEEMELARLRRKSQIKSSRLGRGFRYCNYLLPFGFVLAIFCTVFYSALTILLSQSGSLQFQVILFTASMAAAGLFYLYNIFAPEEFTI